MGAVGRADTSGPKIVNVHLKILFTNPSDFPFLLHTLLGVAEKVFENFK
jgi:hypothetical protein